MSRPRQAQSIPSQIPIRGMASQFSLANMPPEYAIEIVDMEVNNGALETVKGINYRFRATGVDGFVSSMAQHPTDPDQLVFVNVQDTTTILAPYNPFTNVIGSQLAIVYTLNTLDPKAYALNFNSKLFFFMGGEKSTVYNGTTFALTGIIGAATTAPVFGFSFRGRMYIVEPLDDSVWYGDTIGQVTGSFTEFPLNNITKGGGIIMCGFDFTLSSGLDSQSLWAVIMSTGEVILYSGSKPGAADWILAARSRISPPVGYQSIVEVNGDVVVITKAGIVSMRELFTNAQGNVDAATISAPIADYWAAYMDVLKSSLTSFLDVGAPQSLVQGAYHQLKNKLAIFLPGGITSGVESGSTGWTGNGDEAGSTVLIYDFNNKAWTTQKNPAPFSNVEGYAKGVLSPYYHENSEKLLFGSSGTSADEDDGAWELWGSDSGVHVVDVPGTKVSLSPKIISGPLPIGGNKKVNGVQVVHTGDDERKEDVKVNLFAELGAKTSPVTSHVDLTTGASRELYNTGIQGEFVQWKLELTANTDTTPTDTDYQLAAISVVVEPGGVIG